MHLLWFTLAYGAIAFFSGLVIPHGEGLFALVGFALLIATIELVGIWSVFGTGTYLMRVVISHVAGSVIGIAFFLGIGLSTSGSGIGPDIGENVLLVLSGLLLIPPISVAVQLPFWFFRAVCGWQLVHEGGQPTLSFTLRELFTFTFVVALAFATPQMYASLHTNQYGGFNEIDTVGTVAIENLDGTISYVEQQTSAEELEQQKLANDRSIRDMYLFSALSAAITSIIISVLALPVILFMFRPVEPATGCLFSLLYSIAICIFIFSMIALMNGWTLGPGVVEFVGYLVLAIGMSIGAGALPLMVTRCQGFILTSPKHFERDLNRRKQEKANQSSAKIT